MTLPRRVRLTVLAAIVVLLVVGRLVERQRTAWPLPAAAAAGAPARLDHEQMRLDLDVLASPRLQGRATDTAGGRLAAQLIASRFGDLGLTALGGGYEQPFSFVHHSIRALWRRNRPFTKTFNEARNVVGAVTGTALPDAVIVVSAHFDHLGVIHDRLYPGADDNASGTAALLALAAYVARHPLRHTVVFAAFDAEELGLRGSRAFTAHLPFPRSHLRLDINVDMIGRSADRRLFVAGVEQAPSLRPVVEAAARTSRVPVHLGHDRPLYMTGLTDDWTSVSDHASFYAIGVPFLYFGVEDHEDTHEPTDTADRIDMPFYTAAAETVLAALLDADRRLG